MRTPNYRYRATIYASYFGYITQAIVNNLAPLLFVVFQSTFSIPLEKITFLITLNFCIQLVVDLVSAKFVDRIGYRICIVAAHILAAAGLIGLAAFPALFRDPYHGILAAIFLYAVGGGLIEVLISPIVEACPTDNKASVMSLLHSFYCWGTVGVIALSTGFLALFGTAHWRWLTCLWAVVPIVNGIVFTRVPLGTLTAEGEGYSIRKLFSMKLFWLFAILMVAAGASEQAMSQWASAFAEKGLGVSKALGDLAGPCLFSVLMGLARVFYAKFGEKIDLTVAMIGSSLLCIGAYLLAALAPWPLLALVGCGLCGLSVGILWPGIFSVASARIPKGGTAMFALLALAGDLGCSGGPTAVGLIAGAFGDRLQAGLLFAPVFPLALIVCSLLCRKVKSPAEEA